jgi:DNA-binding protein
MSRIIAALATDNDVGVGSKHVDNFAFALITPLHSDQNCVRHVKIEKGKKFSRRILWDTVGTCPQILS